MSVKGFQIDVSIAELNDVDMTGSPAVATGDALIYNSSTQKFEQQPTPIFTGLDALPDVVITKTVGSPLDVDEKEVLSYDNTTSQWVNRKIPDAGLLACSTGLMTGGELQFGTLSGSPVATTTLFTVTAGSAVFVDNYTDPLNPIFSNLTWSEFTDESITSLTTADRTFIAINSAGTLLQQTTDFTPEDHRDVIHIGAIGHANRTNVVAVRNNPHSGFDVNVRLGDLAGAIGAFNITGNIYDAAGSPALTIDKSDGESYRLGNNFHVSKKSPDITIDDLHSSLSFNYSYRDGSGGYILVDATTFVDPENYDNATGGSPPTLTSMPINDWQVQIIKHFPGGAGTRIEYGQTTYGTSASAIDAIADINHEHNPAFAEGIIRGYLVLKQGALDLSNLAEAQFIEAGRFGSAGAAGTTANGIFTSAFESTALSITASSNHTAVHGLGVRPSGMQAFLRCNIAEFGYSVGDEVEFSNGSGGSPATTSYKGLYADTTNISWFTGTDLVVTRLTDGTPINITLANWDIILRAYA